MAVLQILARNFGTPANNYEKYRKFIVRAHGFYWNSEEVSDLAFFRDFGNIRVVIGFITFYGSCNV